MKLGEKILKLRKKNSLSQEELGERINVTRQTISNWELDETTPNAEQLKLLSKEFNVSIDELLDNDVKNVLVDKVSKTENNTKTIIKILLGIVGIALLLFISLVTVKIIIKNTRNTGRRMNESISCIIYGEYHSYNIEFEEYTNIPTALGGDSYFDDILNLGRFDSAYQIFNVINDYVKKNGGTCIRVVDKNVNDYLDVSIKDNSLSSTGLTLIMKIKDEYNFTINYGVEFFIEKYNYSTNKWEKVKEKDGGCVFNEILYTTPPGKTYELKQEWNYCIGALSKGLYRLNKTVGLGIDDSTHFNDYLFNIEFEIE